jgi:hypothetical protein
MSKAFVVAASSSPPPSTIGICCVSVVVVNGGHFGRLWNASEGPTLIGHSGLLLRGPVNRDFFSHVITGASGCCGDSFAALHLHLGVHLPLLMQLLPLHARLPSRLCVEGCWSGVGGRLCGGGRGWGGCGGCRVELMRPPALVVPGGCARVVANWMCTWIR